MDLFQNRERGSNVRKLATGFLVIATLVVIMMMAGCGGRDENLVGTLGLGGQSCLRNNI